jgi:hypothetical protein
LLRSNSPELSINLTPLAEKNSADTTETDTDVSIINLNNSPPTSQNTKQLTAARSSFQVPLDQNNVKLELDEQFKYKSIDDQVSSFADADAPRTSRSQSAARVSYGSLSKGIMNVLRKERSASLEEDKRTIIKPNNEDSTHAYSNKALENDNDSN